MMRSLRYLSMCTSGVALIVSAQAQAQSNADAATPEPTESASGDSAIIVTGSRVVTDGYKAPTPVTVVGSQELKDISPNLNEALRQLPQLTGSTGPSTPSFTPTGSGPTTSSTANLRNLGITRTLVLLDGRRPPASGVTGTADTSLFPLELVKRVDIVTGGASAAYGSDAVAGVVNFVLDTGFRGVSAEVSSGISSRGDGNALNAQLAAGFGFAGDRGSLILSGAIGKQDPIDGTDRAWAQEYWATIPNPLAGQAGQPRLLLRDNVNLAASTFGGIVVTPGALFDTAFDANGNPVAYQHGTLNTGSLEVGGDGAHYPATLVSDVQNYRAFAHASFDVSNSTTVFAEGYYGHSKSVYPNLLPFNLAGAGYVIQADNAYLPDSVRQAMADNDITSFTLSKIDQAWGQNIISTTSDTFNITAGFKSEIGDFILDGYVGHGETRFDLNTLNQRITANARAAADAVVDPASNDIVCRSTLTDPGNGCVPWNPFGTQAYTAAQRAYIGGEGYAKSVAKQDVAALTLRGKLFTNWAGDVAVAVGGEYRRQSGVITVDPISQAVGFAASNAQPSGGKYNVKEGFAEILFPLLRGDNFLRSVDFNGAIRRTSYSTSGGVTTWKVGLTSEVVPGLLLRGTYSQDIRAPNIGDLFGPRVRNLTTVLDPFNNNASTANIITFTGSNPDLLPERAKTIAAGFSYRPEWLPGFGASVDYYNIKINDAISTLPFQRIVDQCFAGDASLCTLITRNGSNVITDIVGVSLNVQTIRISGVDFDASYQTSLAGGKLRLRAIATYLDQYEFIAPGADPVDQAGASSYPHWRGNLQVSYAKGGTTLAVSERFVGAHDRVIPPTTVDDNHVPASFYTNLTLRQEIETGSAVTPELFVTVNNLFDQKPRINETNSLGLGTARYVDPTLDDVVGRYFTVGARIRF